MNAIYNKLRPKRKYHKIPPCGHRNEICDMEHCRLQYAIKPPTKHHYIDEYLHHREKVIKRRREIELQKLDNDQINLIKENIQENDNWVGEYRKRKELKKKYKRMFWNMVGIILAFPIVWILAILITDMFYGK